MKDSGPMARLRWALYSLLVAGILLFVVNAGIEALERRGVLATHDPDDSVQLLTERVWERDGETVRTSAYGVLGFAREQWEARKARKRVFVLGGSFAMGTPYMQGGDEPRPGTIDSFLEAGLERWLGEDVDVINGGAGGQDSNRVREVALEALQHEPDALFVATCNNEGALPPDAVRSWLKEQGGFRLLESILAGGDEPERTMFTAQSGAVAEVAAAFEANLRAIAEAAGEAGVPVALGTLPVHLRYRGLDPGHLVSGDEPGPSSVSVLPDELEVDPVPLDLRGVDPCEAGIRLFEVHEPEVALATLAACLEEGHMVSTPEITAMVLLELGLEEHTEGARALLTERFDVCIEGGLQSYFAGEHAAARAQLAQCDDVSEALRWIGLAAAAQGEPEEARRLLRQSVELRPRNRCRPSFNAIVRAVAAEYPHVTLVDLERTAEARAPQGLPGHEQFLDSCHLNWRGQAAVADDVLAVMGPLLGPESGRGAAAEELAREWGLPLGDGRQQVAVVYRDRELPATCAPGLGFVPLLGGDGVCVDAYPGSDCEERGLERCSDEDWAEAVDRPRNGERTVDGIFELDEPARCCARPR